ncbi:hypothetical protein Psch_03876 [Pelotomaculum schinkii]|uniref:Membrane protein YkvI n=1 Tax=Pelotomaculum schinkii TaxID=78350 RepID=A0A4Y7R577_9FIRM|nr:hypothetical protein Psch_03876 [Pelotomaculum schinkii]
MLSGSGPKGALISLKGQVWLLAKVVTAYIGAVIGAGFASGQEIMQFFILHGASGLKGVALATALFAYLGGYVMFLCTSLKSTGYKEILTLLLGSRVGKVIDILNLCMLLAGLSVMLSGSAAVFGEQFGLPARAGVLVVATLTAMVILGGLDGVLTANVFMVPLKFLAVSLISLAALRLGGGPVNLEPVVPAAAGVAGHWAVAGLLYVSYNMVVPVAVLSSLGRMVPRKIGVAGGVLGGLLLGAAVCLVTLAGLRHFPEASTYQIPLLYLAGRLGYGFQQALGLLIWLAILTTAIAQAHGFASRLAGGALKPYRIFGVGACLLALPLSGFSFAALVRLLYPLFGCVGLALLLALLAAPFSKFFRRPEKMLHIIKRFNIINRKI